MEKNPKMRAEKHKGVTYSIGIEYHNWMLAVYLKNQILKLCLISTLCKNQRMQLPLKETKI